MKAMVAGLIAVTTFSLLSTMVPASATPRTAPSAGTSVSAATALSTATTSATQDRQGTIKSVVRGTFGAAGRVTGNFEPSKFVVKNGKVFGVGMLSAKLIRSDGSVLGRVHRHVAIPLRDGSGGLGASKRCDILDLILGPLHLNLLGLVVNLNKVVLHIIAFAGAGQLLGNLLCLVAHLLDGGPTHLLRLANLLNRILAILQR